MISAGNLLILFPKVLDVRVGKIIALGDGMTSCITLSSMSVVGFQSIRGDG